MKPKGSESGWRPKEKYPDVRAIEPWFKSDNCPVYFPPHEKVFILADYERFEDLLREMYKLCHQPNPDLAATRQIAGRIKRMVTQQKKLEESQIKRE